MGVFSSPVWARVMPHVNGLAGADRSQPGTLKHLVHDTAIPASTRYLSRLLTREPRVSLPTYSAKQDNTQRHSTPLS
jgi:hypothetical protein